MTTPEIDAPHVFISYAWGSETHHNFVVRLAEDLQNCGVYVRLDKWDLTEGQDKYAFMEKMVNDPKVLKVLMLCDRKYCEKANERRGGVGAETQIISSELYTQADQRKFIPLIVERDEEGNELVPIFMKSRIYLDFSSAEAQEESFETLLRAIFNKPLFKRPELGARPRHLDENSNDAIAPWRSTVRQAVAALKAGRNHAANILEDATQRVCDGLLLFQFREISSQLDEENQLVDAIRSTLVPRDDFIEMVRTAVLYVPDDVVLGEVLHAMLERVVQTGTPSLGATRPTFEDLDFFSEEVLLYVIATLLEKRRFIALTNLFQSRYVVPSGTRPGRQAGAFGIGVFMSASNLLNRWNSRQKPGWQSPRGHWMKERANRRDVTWTRIREADFFVYFTQFLSSDYWGTETGPYSVDSTSDSFETFLRAESRAFYSKLAPMWGDKSPEQVRKLVATVNRQNTPSWNHRLLPVAHLARVEQLGTRP